jgi:hypothetical protein
MKISPDVKKALSVTAAAVAGAAVIIAQEKLIPLAPIGTQAVLVAVATSFAHWLNTWGHAERVQDIATDAVAKATGIIPPGAP